MTVIGVLCRGPHGEVFDKTSALVFGLFDFSGGGHEATVASQAAIWLGAAFAGTALIVGRLRMRLQR